MKKLLCTIVLVVAYVGMWAQAPHEIDTIWNREPTYLYQFWFDSADFCHIQKPWCYKDIVWWWRHTEVAKYNYTDSVLRIIGVAAVVCTEPASSFDPLPPDNPGSLVIVDGWTEQMKLYKPTDSGMVLLASQNYSIMDTSRWIRLFINDVYYNTVHTWYRPVFEAYFDEPVLVSDSFYVATTNHYGGDTLRRTVTCTYRYEPMGMYADCWPQHYKVGTVSGGGLNWQHKFESYVWMIFPIIDTVQPVCGVPQGLHVGEQDSVEVHLAWDSAEYSRSWVVAYGRADEDPEGYAEQLCATTVFAIADLVPGVEYAARVRALCFDDETYGDWSDTVRFVREGEVGIDSPEGLRVEVSIRPNPVHTAALVTANAAMRSVEVYDMQGHRVLSRKVHGKRTKIAVGDWPKGSYIVNVNTVRGTNIQKMVIE